MVVAYNDKGEYNLKAQLKLEKERSDKSEQGSNNIRRDFKEINAKGSSSHEVDIAPPKLKSSWTPCRLMSGIERDVVALGMVCNECPKQRGNIECGYFLMKYMKDIIENPEIHILQKVLEAEGLKQLILHNQCYELKE
ncbi:hypothetical protein QJS10_CPB15g01192 [Acorus calamus]|uniref:Uncharacterized protein n=1 Tax=Acorus calamus TaxID=4465 RepID=A0AAV9DA03_ACOCL|nr:hypothetical protein QJS10_CPB15g01192 [Acorus calamus]